MPLSDSCIALGNDDTESPWNETMDIVTSELKVIHLPLVTVYCGEHPLLTKNANKVKRHFRWLSVPSHILHQLTTELSHPDPVQWWIGQFEVYVFRLNSNMQTFVKEHIESLGYQSPVVGVHIRRTDNLTI